MENKSYLDIAEQGTLWWTVMIFLSVIALTYIAIWGFFNQSVQAGFITIIFGLMITMSLLILIFTMFKKVKTHSFDINESWRRPSLFFFIFFTIQIFITKFNSSSGLSLLSIKKNNLFALFSAQMPLIADFFINAIMVPVIEEMFFLFAIPQVIFLSMDAIAKKYTFLGNKFLQIGVAVIISSIAFASFHVGKQNLSFILSAIIFRTIIITLFWGDLFKNFVPFATILASGMVGLHIGNNWGIYGFLAGIKILASNVWGVALLILFLLMLISGLDYIFDFFKKGTQLIGGTS